MTMQNNAIEIAKVLSEKKAHDITVINIAENPHLQIFSSMQPQVLTGSLVHFLTLQKGRQQS